MAVLHPQGYVPCGNGTIEAAAAVFHALSCLAKRYNIDVVADMGTKRPCSPDAPCTAGQPYLQFNSVVAMRSNGEVSE